MHGKQKIKLSHESVTEALMDYLHKHLAAEVRVEGLVWDAEGYAPNHSVSVEFQQVGVCDAGG